MSSWFAFSCAAPVEGVSFVCGPPDPYLNLQLPGPENPVPRIRCVSPTTQLTHHPTCVTKNAQIFSSDIFPDLAAVKPGRGIAVLLWGICSCVLHARFTSNVCCTVFHTEIETMYVHTLCTRRNQCMYTHICTHSRYKLETCFSDESAKTGKLFTTIFQMRQAFLKVTAIMLWPARLKEFQIIKISA